MNSEIILKIIESYHSDRDKVASTLNAVRVSRKYGFSIINENTEKSEQEQLLWAVRFLLSIADIPQSEDLPMDDSEFCKAMLISLEETILESDALQLIVIGNSTANRLPKDKNS